MIFRVGNGFDAHQLVSGIPLVLGGVSIPVEYGLQGHSDGDALLHAIADALLGAACLGDLGDYFPATKAWENASSRLILTEVIKLLHERHWGINNIDTTIIAQKPRVKEFVQAMRENIANDCQLDLNCISIKATTTDCLGFTGRGEGIAVAATVLIFAK